MRSDDILPDETEHSFDIFQNLDRGLDDEPAGTSKLPRKRTAFPGHSRDALMGDADERDLFSTPISGDTGMFFAAAGAEPAPYAAEPAGGQETVLMPSSRTEAPAAVGTADDQATVLMGAASADEDSQRTVLMDDDAIDRPVSTRRLSLDDSEELPSLDADDDLGETEFSPYTFGAEEADEDGAEPNAGTWINYGFDGDSSASDADKRKRIAIFVGIALVAVALVGTLAWFFLLRPAPEPEPVEPEPIEQPQEPEPLQTSLTVDAPEWVADYGTFNFSVTDAAGTEVTALQVTPGTPVDLTLGAGTYTVTATQVPALADGRTYCYLAPHTLEVTEDMMEEGAPLSDAWAFTIIDPNDQAAVDAAVAALPAEQQEAARAFYDGRKTAEPEPEVTDAATETDAADTADAASDTSNDYTYNPPSYNYGNTGGGYTPPADNGGSTGGSGSTQPDPAPSDPGTGTGTGDETGDNGDSAGDNTGNGGSQGGGSQGGGSQGGDTGTGGGTGDNMGDGSTGDGTGTVDPGGPAVGVL